MTSLRAAAVVPALRALRHRSHVDRRLDGRLGVGSAEPGRAVRHVARVHRGDAGGHAVWRLDPHHACPGAPVVFFLHGGAYVNGFDRRHWTFLARLARATGATIVAVDYPLAPRNTAAAVVGWTLDRYRAVADQGAPVVVAGDSAGGGLALALAMQSRDAGLPAPRRLVLLAPWLDAALDHPRAVALDRRDPFLSLAGLRRAGRAYAGGLDLRDPMVSPLHGNLRDLPPASVYVGTRDQLVADARRLSQRARRTAPGWELAVHEAPGMVHDWMLIEFLPEARRALASIADDITR